MNNNAPDNSHLLNFIAATVETMRDQMATKSDVTRLGDKVEAEFAAVRGDIEQACLRLDSIERTLHAPFNEIESEDSLSSL